MCEALFLGPGMLVILGSNEVCLPGVVRQSGVMWGPIDWLEVSREVWSACVLSTHCLGHLS